MFRLKLNKQFNPLEVVGRGSETQLQVGENINKLTERDNGNSCMFSALKMGNSSIEKSPVYLELACLE